ncbi:MAG: LysE family transporter, partial [Maribacter sp.]|nr:LysE family transporter [Maribacter sp.]
SNQPGLYVFGGAILFVYGLIIFIKRSANKVTGKDSIDVKVSTGDYWSLLAKGFLLNFINIGVLVFWLGVIIVVGPSLGNEPNRMIVFFSTVIIAYFVTDIFKILLAKQLKSRLTEERIYLIKKILGIILILCGVVLIIKGFLPKDQFNIEKGIEKIEHIR